MLLGQKYSRCGADCQCPLPRILSRATRKIRKRVQKSVSAVCLAPMLYYPIGRAGRRFLRSCGFCPGTPLRRGIGVRMRLMDRYLLREMVVPFLIGQAAIVLMLTGTVLYNNADVLLVNQVPWQFVARMVIFFLPFLIHMTMPVAMAVAASLAVSRLGRDSEITVLRAAGISLVRIFLPIFVVGLLASVADFYFGEVVVPRAVDRFQGVLNEIPTHIPRLQPQAGQWIVASDQSYALFIRTMIPRKGYVELHGIKIDASPEAIYNQEAQHIDFWAENGTFR